MKIIVYNHYSLKNSNGFENNCERYLTKRNILCIIRFTTKSSKSLQEEVANIITMRGPHSRKSRGSP